MGMSFFPEGVRDRDDHINIMARPLALIERLKRPKDMQYHPFDTILFLKYNRCENNQGDLLSTY
jgi:hypothetical protein